jgi:hypothetical protein
VELVVHQGSPAGWATLDVQTFPVLAGNSPDRTEWECPCGRRLATGLYDRQVLDILIRCGGCSRLLQSPLRAPGEPIAGAPVYMHPDKTYLLKGQLNLGDNTAMMVGHAAFAGYARETGRRVPGVYVPDRVTALKGLDAESFAALAEGLRSLLGVDYERLEMSDARGRRSRTPPATRHRIIELERFAADTATRLGAWDGHSRFNLNGDLVAEAITALTFPNRWQHHPAWPALRATLASESEAPHTVMMLTAASYLVDAGNGVGVYVTTSRQNVSTADLWIEPRLGQRVDLEVKTPLALRGPKTPISQPHAIALVERALKKSGRQRSNTRSSLLAIGGYHLGVSYDTLVGTAKAILALERRKWRGLAGILITDCTYEFGPSDNGDGFTFEPIARTEIALHPGYRGDLSIRVETGPLAFPPVEGDPS